MSPSMARPAASVLVVCILAFFAQARGFSSSGARTLVKASAEPARQFAVNPTTFKTDKPLIGILVQPCHNCPGRSYIGAAYAKWAEMAGARMVPIRPYDSDEELKRLFNSVNGLILPGGLVDIWLDDPYVIAARKLFHMAIEANDKGDPFPIHGTCLGHQLLHVLTAEENFTELLITTNAVSHRSTLNFTEAAADSLYFKTMTGPLLDKLQDPAWNIVIQNHEFGVPPATYAKYSEIAGNWSIISYSADRNGTQYVSTVQHKRYPFFGTQWHPEKPPFEFSLAAIPHSTEAISVSQHLATVFIEVARTSAHKPENATAELDMLIYNYPVVFTAKEAVMEPSYDGPDITYFFDQPLANITAPYKPLGIFA